MKKYESTCLLRRANASNVILSCNISIAHIFFFYRQTDLMPWKMARNDILITHWWIDIYDHLTFLVCNVYTFTHSMNLISGSSTQNYIRPSVAFEWFFMCSMQCHLIIFGLVDKMRSYVFYEKKIKTFTDPTMIFSFCFPRASSSDACHKPLSSYLCLQLFSRI